MHLPSTIASALGILRSLAIYYAPARRVPLDRMHARFLAQGDLAFDIGSHVGDRIASMRRLGVRVVAVEPQPLLAALLRRLYGRDPGVAIVEAAVGAKSDSVRLHLNLANPTVSTASAGFIAAAHGALGWQGQRWDRTVMVEQTTLDALIARFGEPRFIKIDVEGYELEVLRGLSRAPPALSFEFTTIQRGQARAARRRCGRLGGCLFNAALGEEQLLLHNSWLDGEGIDAWLDALPNAANSGDIYARRTAREGFCNHSSIIRSREPTMHQPILFPILALGLAAPSLADDSLPELVPREVLFGNPTRTQARIAPNGAHLSWLAPSQEGVLNVWVQPADRSAAPRQVTEDTQRGIRRHHWSEDGQRILYLQDEGGDENWHLYAVDLEGGSARNLTPFDGVRAENLITDPVRPKQVLVGLNKRDPSVFDMYRIDLESGELTLDTKNPGDVTGWLTDAQFRIRAAEATDPESGDTIIRARSAEDQPWRELLRFPFGENGSAIGFDKDGGRLFMTSSLEADTTRLVAVDVETGEVIDELAQDPQSDVSSVIAHPTEHRIQAVEFDYLKPRWEVIDEAIADDLAYLRDQGEGTLIVGDRTLADDRWIVAFQPDDGPTSYYLYQREPRRAERLFVTRPELAEYRLAEMQPLVVTARDGLKLPSYLTRPPGIEGKELPMVLLVHGGPWARDDWGYDAQAQWLANRGYAVLQVNFRGSTGFGEAFLNAGNEEWGVGAMQHDLTDAVRWAVEQGIADPERVCIFGGSYGGYATLAGLAFTPELYACGVDIVGPSHIKTLFESIPPYWAPAKRELVLRVGDVENDEALNRRISPFFHAEQIEAPLMVLQGANDPRVKIAESNQIVEAMRAKELPVTYVVFPDEGHGFARPENRLDAFARIEQFLAEHLGGRAEPVKPIPGSTAELR